MSARERGLSLQERLEQSRVGRGLISVFVVATLAVVVVENLPQSTLRRDVLRVGQPYLNAVGLDQSWALFAPDPRRRSIALQGVVQYADGRSLIWQAPHDGALFGEYWDYHWQKWVEWVLDSRHRALWRPAAIFIARDSERPGRWPLRVTLVRVTSLNNPPGVRPDHEPSIAEPYYNLRISPTMLDRRGHP